MGCIPSKAAVALADSGGHSNKSRKVRRKAQGQSHVVCLLPFTSERSTYLLMDRRVPNHLEARELRYVSYTVVCMNTSDAIHVQGVPTTQTTRKTDQQLSPVYPPAAFSTPGRVLGGDSPILVEDGRTGPKIYSPNDPNHPSRRPTSAAFRQKYRHYYDGTYAQMPTRINVSLLHHVIGLLLTFIRIKWD